MDAKKVIEMKKAVMKSYMLVKNLKGEEFLNDEDLYIMLTKTAIEIDKLFDYRFLTQEEMSTLANMLFNLVSFEVEVDSKKIVRNFVKVYKSYKKRNMDGKEFIASEIVDFKEDIRIEMFRDLYKNISDEGYPKYYLKGIESERFNGLVEINKYLLNALEATGKYIVYGYKEIPSSHTIEKHLNCKEENCMICATISNCLVCKEYEAGLTSECCGRKLTEEESEKVQKGEINYKFGRWVDSYKSNCTCAQDLLDNISALCRSFTERSIEETSSYNKQRLYNVYEYRLTQWGADEYTQQQYLSKLKISLNLE